MNLAPVSSVTGPQRRRLFAGGTLALVIAAWIVLGAAPAFADEFTVGLVPDRATSGSTSSAFMEGFQLAVDQSPDVSHPPDTEGGDHLGSMDVVMSIVDATLQPDEIVDATMALITTDRVPIVVVDAPGVLASLVDPVTDTDTLLITLSEPDESVATQASVFFADTDRDATQMLLTDRVPGFDAAYVSAYGRSPSPAAVRGYLAGRLVDLSVEATDRDPFDYETVVAALADATGALSPVSPEVGGDERPVSTVLPTPPQAAVPTAAAEQSGGSAVAEFLSRFALVAVLGLGTAAAVHFYWAAGGIWPGSDRADLARKVVGSTDEFPSTAMTLGVAILLMMGAVVVGGATGLWGLPASDALVTAAAWAVAGVLIVRAVVGFVLSGRRQASERGTPFSIRDLAVYSPLTLILGASTVLALVSTN